MTVKTRNLEHILRSLVSLSTALLTSSTTDSTSWIIFPLHSSSHYNMQMASITSLPFAVITSLPLGSFLPGQSSLMSLWWSWGSPLRGDTRHLFISPLLLCTLLHLDMIKSWQQQQLLFHSHHIWANSVLDISHVFTHSSQTPSKQAELYFYRWVQGGQRNKWNNVPKAKSKTHLSDSKVHAFLPQQKGRCLVSTSWQAGA